MATRSYVVAVPVVDGTDQCYPNHEKLAAEMQKLLGRIDAAGESVIAVQAINAGKGETVTHICGSGSEFGAGYGFSYTHALLVITRTS